MQEKLEASEKVIKGLLNALRRSESTAPQANTDSREATAAASLAAQETLDRAEGSTFPPAGASLAHSFDNMEIESHITTTVEAMAPNPPTNDKVRESPDAGSWGWNESNYQLESTNHAFETPNAQTLTVDSLGAENLQPPSHKTGERAEAGSREFLLAQQVSQGVTNIAPGSWTDITDDVDLVHHLLALFFCWEYPTFVSLSREHFISDFRNGINRYCSPILVNAILALGCRFSNHAFGRSMPEDPLSAGDLFFHETNRLIKSEPNLHSLPIIQALGLMSLREISCGRQANAHYLAGQAVRLTFEMGLHDPREGKFTRDDLIVRSATFWGVYALDNIWSTIVPALPHSSKHAILPPRLNLITAMDNLIWIPYADNGAISEHPCIQPAQIAAVFNCFSQLSEIMHRATYQQQLPVDEDRITKLLDIYSSYLAWYATAPEMIQVSRDSTPTVLFLQYVTATHST